MNISRSHNAHIFEQVQKQFISIKKTKKEKETLHKHLVNTLRTQYDIASHSRQEIGNHIL